MPVLVWRYLGKTVLALSLGGATTLAMAQQDPSEWGRKVMGQISGTPSFVNELLVTGGFEGGALVIPDFSADLGKASYLKVASAGNTDFLLALNSRRLADTQITPDLLAQASGVTFVLNTAAARWQLSQRQGQNSKTLVSARAPRSKNAAAVADWLLNQLGYDGIVLDRRDKLLLVGTTRSKLRPAKLQAVAIKNSKDVFNLGKAGRKNTEGLLSLEKKSGPFATFRIKFISPNSEIGQGTKLIFERVK